MNILIFDIFGVLFFCSSKYPPSLNLSHNVCITTDILEFLFRGAEYHFSKESKATLQRYEVRIVSRPAAFCLDWSMSLSATGAL